MQVEPLQVLVINCRNPGLHNSIKLRSTIRTEDRNMNSSESIPQRRKRMRASKIASLMICSAGCIMSTHPTTTQGFSFLSSVLYPRSQIHLSSGNRRANNDHHTNPSTNPLLPSPEVQPSSLPSDDNRRAKISSTLLSGHGESLTNEEVKQLLSEVVELRRIKAVEASILKQMEPRKSDSLLPAYLEDSSVLEFAKAAGYGTDVQGYEMAIMKGHKAREDLVTRNMGLVHFCVSEVIGTRRKSPVSKNAASWSQYVSSERRLNSLSRDDLVQEGVFGLTRAIDRWNPVIGGTFSTYAVYWIRAAVLRCIANNDDLMRVPEYVTQNVRQVTKAAWALGIELKSFYYESAEEEISDRLLGYKGKKQGDEEEVDLKIKALAAETGLTVEKVQQAIEVHGRRSKGGYVAFDETWMFKNDKSVGVDSDIFTRAMLSQQEYNADISSSADMEDLQNKLSPFLKPKEMEALCWRYGIFSDTAPQEHVDGKLSCRVMKRKRRNYLAEAEAELFGSPEKTVKKKKVTAGKGGKIPVSGKWGEAMSFNEVGNQMQVSAEYGRRLCHAALNKLRQAADDGRLEPALLL